MNRRLEKRLRIASVLGLLALALMLWSVFDPRPIPLFVAMSAGQVIGTGSFVLYVFAILADSRT